MGSLLSGFCNPGNDLASHRRCRKADCPCACGHRAPESDPAPEGEGEQFDATLVPDPGPVSLEDAIEVYVAAGELLNRAALGAIAPLPAEQALRLLYRLREGLEHGRVTDASLVTHAYLHGERGDVRLDGLPAARVQRGRERKSWDERGVARAVIDHRMAERGFEVPDDPWDVAEWLLEVFGVQYCRVTPLRDAGLEPEAFCESSPGKVSVQFID